MTVREFANRIDTLVKYKGDVRNYVIENIKYVEFPFSLNDSFTAKVTDIGAKINEHWKKCYDKDERIRLQFHEIQNTKSCFGEKLPLVECKFQLCQEPIDPEEED